MPNKELNKPDSYHGHWRDGKIHGFGKYMSVLRTAFYSAVVQQVNDASALAAMSEPAVVAKM